MRVDNERAPDGKGARSGGRSTGVWPVAAAALLLLLAALLFVASPGNLLSLPPRAVGTSPAALGAGGVGADDDGGVELVLMIKTAPAMFGRRELARRTWLDVPAVRSGAVRAMFMTEADDGAPDARAGAPAPDVLLTPFGGGRKPTVECALFAMAEMAARHPRFKAYALLDDDVFVCLDRILSDIRSPGWPGGGGAARGWAWGRFFCGAGDGRGKVVADENFLVLSGDVVRGIVAARPLLRLDRKASFAAHFGMWQHFFDIRILDDQGRVSPAPGLAFLQAARSGADFCEGHVHAHYARNESDVEAAYGALLRRRRGDLGGEGVSSDYPPPPLDAMGRICSHDPELIGGGVLFDPSETTMGPDAPFPLLMASPGYRFVDGDG